MLLATVIPSSHNDEWPDMYRRLIKLNFLCLFFPHRNLYDLIYIASRVLFFESLRRSKRLCSKFNWIDVKSYSLHERKRAIGGFLYSPPNKKTNTRQSVDGFIALLTLSFRILSKLMFIYFKSLLAILETHLWYLSWMKIFRFFMVDINAHKILIVLDYQFIWTW